MSNSPTPIERTNAAVYGLPDDWRLKRKAVRA